MSDVNKFRFVSPGIFLNEVDQSQLPTDAELVGPVIVGRTSKGPGMIPVRVTSFSQFVEIFGQPISGRAAVLDVWRDGNYSSPTYGAYAAQAYLRAGIGPVTFIRLVGTQSPDATEANGGNAGWATVDDPAAAVADNGGAYGLFVWPSASADTTSTGSLAAIWYVNNGGAVVLSGSSVDDTTLSGAATVIKSDSNGQFKALIYNSAGSTEKNVTFSLAEGSSNFIRKVFNTNPQLVNTTIEDSTNQTSYWLGETFERHLNSLSLDTAAVRYGAIMAIASGSTLSGPQDRDIPYRDAHTGWFFAQNTSADTASYAYNDMQKLFKFVGINGHGEWLQNNIKISIQNIKASQNDNINYGTFDVVIRNVKDSDLTPQVLEVFSEVDLDPGSPNYIGLQIGDTYMDWDETEKRYREYGQYPNRSKYVRVVLNEAVDAGSADASLLPFGVYGPPRLPAWSYYSGSTAFSGHPSSTAYALGSTSIPHVNSAVGSEVLYTTAEFNTASIVHPAVGIRSTATSDGALPTTTAHFGLHSGKTGTSTLFDNGYADYLRAFGRLIVSDSDWGDSFGAGSLPNNLEYQWIFSLDELVVTTGSAFSSASPSSNITEVTWTSGSYVAGTSWNASNSLGAGAAVFENILDSKVNRFTSPLYGAFDGLDVTERDPFRNTRIDDSEAEATNYTYYTLRRAIDTVADAEVVEMNALAIPGITNEGITKYIIDTCETRADALGVIDLKGGFQPRHESSAAITTRRGNLQNVINNMKARNLNNSYGAAYYPWVKIRDDLSGNQLEVPPSVVALGVLANTEKTADIWFAPAGFRRGGLSQGASGLSVVGVETKLTSENRDDLYALNINPIASFPREGIVVFGQKTLQVTRSALDRINVRRLLIYVKRGISAISRDTLFQPNVQATWNDFKGRADKFLGDVKVRFGVDDFKVVLDETTTTPDLVDRNILYAKIYIKPTRAIEFIAIDFIITRSGASFED